MASAAKKLMTASEFLGWVASRPKHPRHELVGGLVIEMAAERLVHGRLKAAIALQIGNQLAGAGPCELFIDGVAVQADDANVFEPDLLVDCSRGGDTDLVIDTPVVVFEILSPSTRGSDLRVKVPAYMKIPTVKALVLVDPERRLAAVHWGGSGGFGSMTEFTENDEIMIDLGSDRGAPLRLDLGAVWSVVSD